MILLKILEHDLHAAKKEGSVPLWVGVPARAGFLPALVTNTHGEFVPIRFLGPAPGLRRGFPDAAWEDDRVYSFVFPYDSDRVDDLVAPMVSAAYSLSFEEGWTNVVSGRGVARRAFDYIQKQAGVGFPHACLYPRSWKPPRVKKFFGQKNLDEKMRRYRDWCRVVPTEVLMPVFLSRPDMVGMYTQFMGGKSSILLHNVRRGMAFCPDLE